jgi:methionyl-tRNA formyltransferase
MKILILTSSLYGTASHHLEYLVNRPQIEISMVVYSEGKIQNRKKRILNKLGKIFNIGLLGALNGIRMRKWYGDDLKKYRKVYDLESRCLELNIPFFRSEGINCETTETLFKDSNADLAISLGNGYISKRIFSIPRYGMINIHHEILPQYRNAQSIVWQLYNGSTETGYSIHRIDSKIDTGEIILQETIQIAFRDTLADTVTYNYSRLLENSAGGLVRVLENFNLFASEAVSQGPGRSYTTPSFRQYLKMERQFRKLKDKQI